MPKSFVFRVISTKAAAFTQHESGNFKEKYHLQPTGLTNQVSDNMTFSKSPKDLLTVKVNVFKEIHHGRGATQV